MNNQRRSSTKSLSLFPDLPDELIRQILLRLPVKSLLCFKSLCKSWLSLISDPQFGKSHFDLAASPTYRCFTKANDSEIESLDINASLHNYESSIVKFKFPLSSNLEEQYNQFQNYRVTFFGSCRGFVLVAYAWAHVFIWNPSTGVHRQIVDNPEEIMYQFLPGFGYYTSTDDYLLVIIYAIPFDDFDEDSDIIAQEDYTSIAIFSMKTNSWFHQKSTNVQYVELDSGAFRQVGSFLNEALHWLVISYETELHVIIAFDLVQRTLSEIPLSPILVRESEEKNYSLRVMGGCLSLCYPGDADSRAEIWMMKEYKELSSWTKLFVFSTCNIPYNGFFPICLTKHGRIFGSNGYGRIMVLNNKGRLLDQCTTHLEPNEFKNTQTHCGMYRDSLLSLPTGFEEASEDDKLTSA